MKKTMWTVAIAAFAGVVVLGGGSVLAGPIERLGQGMDILTADQQTLVREFAAAHKGECREVRGHLRDSLGELAALQEDLAITDEQREAIRAIVAAYREPMKEAVAAVVAAKKELRLAVTAEGTDEEAITAASVSVGYALADAGILASGALDEVRGVLTEEQAATLKAFMEERAAEREAHAETAVDRFNDLVELWNALDLSPEQVAEIKQRIEERRDAVHQRIEERKEERGDRAPSFADRFKLRRGRVQQ